MSYHCRGWTSNITGAFPEVTFTDGDDTDELYRQARCTRFTIQGWFSIDDDGDQVDSGWGDESPDCDDHGNYAEEEYRPIIEDLERAGFYVCHDDDQVYHDLEGLETHREDDHDGEAEDAETDAAVYASVFNRTRGIRTTHGSWAQP